MRELNLFVAQGDHGVDAHGAAGWDVTCRERDKSEQDGDGNDGDRIIGVDTVEHGGEVTHHSQRCGDADGGADQRQHNSLAQDQLQYACGLRAERHANADFARAARNFVGKQAVQSDASENQREQRKESGEARDQTLLKKQTIDLLGFGDDVEERQVGVHLRHGLADRGKDGARVGGGAQFESCSSDVLRRIHGGVDVAAQIAVFRVTNDADDFVAGIGRAVFVRRSSAELLAQRIFLADIFFDEGAIHDYRSGRGSGSVSAVAGGEREIRSVEGAAGEEGDVQCVEEIGADAEGVGFGLLILGSAGPMEDGDHQAVAEERHHGVAGGFHAGSLREAALEVAVEAVNLRTFVAGEARVNVEDQDIVRIEADVHTAQVGEGANEKSGADEHDDGERDLRADERIADAKPFSAGVAGTGGASFAFFERGS